MLFVRSGIQLGGNVTSLALVHTRIFSAQSSLSLSNRVFAHCSDQEMGEGLNVLELSSFLIPLPKEKKFFIPERFRIGNPTMNMIACALTAMAAVGSWKDSRRIECLDGG